MRIVVVLNGPINAGKTTVGKALAAAIDDAAFIDGDDNGLPDGAPLDVIIEASLRRLSSEIAANPAGVLVLAYPLREADHARLEAAAEAAGRRLWTVTLAPPIEVVLGDRGDRRLDDWERGRIREMYAEGYHDRAFSDLTIAGTPGVEAAVDIILGSLLPARPIRRS
jgi:chloramphenicol 3-O-phosphotransferase